MLKIKTVQISLDEDDEKLNTFLYGIRTQAEQDEQQIIEMWAQFDMLGAKLFRSEKLSVHIETSILRYL